MSLALRVGLTLVLAAAAVDLSAQSDPYGVVSSGNVGDDPNPNPPVERYSELGIGWVRATVDWDEIQPVPDTPPAQWRWGKADLLVQRLTDAGLQIYWEFSYSACWANGMPANAQGCIKYSDRYVPPDVGDPDHPYAAYRLFITEVVKRYKDKVHHWGTWNELNAAGGPDQHPRPFYDVPGVGSHRERVVHYATHLLPLVVEAIKAGDSNARIVVGELTNREGGNPDGWGDTLEDLRILLDAAPVYDIISQHIYNGGDVCSNRIAFADLLHQRHGQAKVWITETGINTANEFAKAQYINCIMNGMRARSGWWKKTFYYRMEFEPGLYWGLLHQNNEPRLSWFRYQDYILGGTQNPPDEPEPNTPKPPGPGEDDPNNGVRFEWFPASGAVDYHLRVERPDSSLVFQAFTPDTFYRSGPGVLQQGSTYKWIVKGRNPAHPGGGNWSPESYFQVVAPFPNAPAAQPVGVGPSGCITTQQPTFSWNYSAPGGIDATTFRMIILEVVDPSGNDPTIYDSGDRGGDQHTPPITLQSGQTYRWRVRPKNSSGEGQYWSNSTYFTPNCAAGLYVTDGQALEGSAGAGRVALVPVRSNPTATHPVTVNYATANGTAIAGADYTGISGVLTFAPGQNEAVISVPILGDALDEQNETLTVNLSGAQGSPIADAQGLVLILDDDSAPTAPFGPSPAVGSTVAAPAVTLAWTGGDPDPGDVVRYEVQLGLSSPPPSVATDLPATSFLTAELLANRTYYWRIVARDQAGNTTTGPIWHFLTPVSFPPRVPYAPEPANGVDASTALVRLAWLGGDPDPGDTVTYDVYLAGGTSAPRVLPQVATGLAQPSLAPQVLRAGWTYAWRVVARDQTGLTTTGPTWSFRVPAQPGCVTVPTIPYTITEGGRYCLDRDHSTGIASGYAIRVLADDVTIDLNGFTLAGTGGLGTTAYGVTTAETTRRNVAVRNGTIRGFFMGVFLGPGEGLNVERLRVSDSTYAGIWLSGQGSVRASEVSNTGGTTLPHLSSEGRYGIVLYTQGSSAIGNTIVDAGTAFDSAPCYGIRVLGAHRSVVEGNRIVRSAGLAAADRSGILVDGAESVTAVGNRLTYLDVGIEYTLGASGPYRDNVAASCSTPYIGGTNAGNNF